MAKCILDGMTRKQANAYANSLNANFKKEPAKVQSLKPTVKIVDTSKYKSKAKTSKKK